MPKKQKIITLPDFLVPAEQPPKGASVTVDEAPFDLFENSVNYPDFCDLLPTPIDSMSGLPFPIIPGADIEAVRSAGLTNKNHAFFPRNHSLLQTIGGKALRVCRIQTIEAYYHNDGPRSYHRFYRPPAIPITEDQQLKTVVFAVSGYVPKQGIDLSEGEPAERLMTDEEYDRLRTMREGEYVYIRHANCAVMAFLRKVILNNAVNVPTEKLQAFVESKELEVRRKIGIDILKESAEIAALGIEKAYVRALENGDFRPNVPTAPAGLLHKSFTNPERTEMQIFGNLSTIAKLAIAA